jgi:CheY-like chemotaxis protein
MAHVLVVEDDDLVRSMLRTTLESEGYEVTVAGDGEEAIGILSRQPFELVVTDIVMPRKEGLETIIEAKKMYPQLKIIAISGGGRVAPTLYLDNALVLGADRVFVKPVAQNELLSAIGELLAEEADSRR